MTLKQAKENQFTAATEFSIFPVTQRHYSPTTNSTNSADKTLRINSSGLRPATFALNKPTLDHSLVLHVISVSGQYPWTVKYKKYVYVEAK